MYFPRVSSLAMLALLGGGMALTPRPALAQISVGISVAIAPPILPIYVQPPLPAPDSIWAPGYWAWDGGVSDYYWVPGTWVLAPRPGYLWTPGYWGYGNGGYLFHQGYWGSHVGFYGGVNYGYGYTGDGYQGGYWQGRHYFYNRSVNNFGNVHVTNVYNRTVINNTVNHVSFNGGPGGIVSRPNAAELAAARDQHIDATPLQTQHIAAARANHALFFSANHGAPAIAATARPGEFSGAGVVHATNAPRPAQQPHATAPIAHAPEANIAAHPPAVSNAHPMPAQPAPEKPAMPAISHPKTETPVSHPQNSPPPVHAQEPMQPRPPMQSHPVSAAPIASPAAPQMARPAPPPYHAAPRPPRPPRPAGSHPQRQQKKPNP